MEMFLNDSVDLILDTKIDVSNFIEWKIKYKRPDGVTGEWDAVVDTSNTKYIKTSLINKASMNGTWLVQAYVSDGTRSYHGKWVELKILSPLS